MGTTLGTPLLNGTYSAPAYNAEDDKRNKMSSSAAPAGGAAEGVASSDSSSPTGAQPAAAPAQPASVAAMPPTFAQMQQAGQARPAPPPTAAMPTFGAAPSALAGSPLQPQILAALQQQLANPSSYTSDAMARERAAGARQIDDKFATDQQLLTEEMARRGLSDSSIRGGRMADLNVGKRSAEVELEDRLQQKLADTQAADLRAALAQAMGYDESMFNRTIQQGQLDLGRDTLGLERDKFGYQQSNDAANRAQDMDQFLQQLGLQREDLGLRRDDLNYRREESAADRAQRASEFDRSYGLQKDAAALDRSKFDYAKEMDRIEQAFREKGLEFDREKFAKTFNLDERQFNAAQDQNAWERDQRTKEFEFNKDTNQWERKQRETEFDWQKNNDIVNWLPTLMAQMFGGDPSSYAVPAGGGGNPAVGGPGGGYYTGTPEQRFLM